MRMKWVVIAMVAVGAAGAGAWWVLARSDQAEADSQGATALVQRRDLVARVAATGKVNAMVGAEVRVGSRVSGRVQRLHANIGDSFGATGDRRIGEGRSTGTPGTTARRTESGRSETILG